MSSMRIDGDKSAKVWAKRLKNLVDFAEADGVAFLPAESEDPNIPDVVLVYKEGTSILVPLKIWSDE